MAGIGPDYEPPLYDWTARQLHVPIPPGGPVQMRDLTAADWREMNAAMFLGNAATTLTFTDAAPGAVTYVSGTDWQALAEFRADVIATLTREIADLKADRDQAAASYRHVKDTNGDVLARAMRADSATGAYGR